MKTILERYEDALEATLRGTDGPPELERKLREFSRVWFWIGANALAQGLDETVELDIDDAVQATEALRDEVKAQTDDVIDHILGGGEVH